MNINKQVSVANSAVGTNIIDGEEKSRVGFNRMIVAFALVGGNAVGEEEVEIRVAGKGMAKIAGSATGLGIISTSWEADRLLVPANELVEAVVLVAPTVSPTRFAIKFIP